jgi:endonuclease/exonuclease/phosphatase family metal-dependent hydrolase
MIRRSRPLSVSLVALATALSGGCAMAHQMSVDAAAPTSCRMVASNAVDQMVPVRWVGPDDADDRADLDAWCAGVGPALVDRVTLSGDPAVDALAIVSWNVNVGAGDLAALVADLRAGALTDGRPVTHFVLLLQEAHRDSAQVPVDLVGARTARPLQPASRTGARVDIADAAATLGLGVYYVPSMRNGAPHQTREDRGNAILSTLRLSDLTAIELPFERQRRVAIEATVHGMRTSGEPWAMRVTSVHLDNRAPAKRLWVFATLSRVRQARGLLDGMRGDGAAVLGGDLNTWGGFNDDAYRTIAARLPVEADDRRATFHGVARLDHLLFRLPDGWTVDTSRLERYGSDHHPLLARIDIGHATRD